MFVWQVSQYSVSYVYEFVGAWTKGDNCRLASSQQCAHCCLSSLCNGQLLAAATIMVPKTQRTPLGRGRMPLLLRLILMLPVQGTWNASQVQRQLAPQPLHQPALSAAALWGNRGPLSLLVKDCSCNYPNLFPGMVP